MEIKPLKNCPFCGFKPSIYITVDNGIKRYQIGCKKCGMFYTNKAASKSETATITAFNKRYGEQDA